MGVQHLMQQRVYARRVTGRDHYGRETYADVGPIECLIEGKNNRVTNASGEEVVSGTTVYCDAFYPEIVEGDTARLPTYDSSGDVVPGVYQDERIISVASFYDKSGPVYSVWYLR